MSKRTKKDKKHLADEILLITSLIKLIEALINIISKLLEQ